MFTTLLTPLIDTLRLHFAVSKTRLETLAVLMVGLSHCRTVNLSHLASLFPGPALHASNYRRLQRFFQYTRLDGDVVAVLIVRLLNLSRPKMLVLDRTNWTLGTKDINILVLAIVTRRFRLPLMWTLLNSQGNSNTSQRIELIRRYLRLFPASSIEMLLADREFIGAQWMEFLNQNNIAFAIRLRGTLQVCLTQGGTCQVHTLLRKRRHGEWAGWLSDMAHTPGNLLHFATKRIKGDEPLIIATNACPRRALQAYRKRWSVECLFSDTKTRGFNIEDTHITNPEKLATLMAIVALTTTWVYRCASQSMGLKAIKRKSHGRREKSWFRTGLDALRNWILLKPEKAIKAWQKTAPKIPMSTPET
jgi:hypothetical protein